MIRTPAKIWAAACLLFLIALAGIGAMRSAPDSHHAPQSIPSPVVQSDTMVSLPVADLSEIRFRRKFRILIPANAQARNGAKSENDAAQRHIELIEQFAEEQFLLPVRVVVPRWHDLPAALNAGHGDLIAAHMQIRELRERDTPFTVPVVTIREVLVSRRADKIRTAADLRGREIALRARSSFWPKLHELRQIEPNIKVRIIDDSSDAKTVLAKIANMRFDMAVIDYGARELGVAPWQGLHATPQFSNTAYFAFGVHPKNTELKRALNDFLMREQLVHRDTPPNTDDLGEISKRGVLRVLTRNNDSSYFIWRGRPLGFEYELIRRFAERQKLSLEMILSPSHDELLPALLKGTGDIAATNFLPSAQPNSQGITFTRPYRAVKKYVITHPDDDSLRSPAGLWGRTLTLRHSSPAWTHVRQLVEQGMSIKIDTLPESVRGEEIVAGVASGLYDSTITDDYAINTALNSPDAVRSAFALTQPLAMSWAVRANNPQLLKALNTFLDKEYKQLFYNIIHKRYFENTRLQRARSSARIRGALDVRQLSPYDDIVREQAKKYGFDWPLIVAVMFRESRFDPNAASWAGAKGLMQMLPATAKRFGVSDLSDPTTSITAGVRMMSWLFNQLDDELSIQARTWFTLAAYNAGLGHLYDARRLARELNLDPNLWFENVEKAMRLLRRPEYYRKSRHGYVRGFEPVRYVRDIRELYTAYKSLQDS
jgi:membrane-bound lytic murein transglycosylase F